MVQETGQSKDASPFPQKHAENKKGQEEEERQKRGLLC
jgi:hypothetical protein